MIRQLRTYTNADRFRNDVRSRRPRYGRYVYLAAVAVLLAYLGNLFAGPLLWLQADGIVSAERVAVAFPYEAEVMEVALRPGQTVSRGDVLGTVRSAQVADTIANLTARYAETYARQAELMIRVEVANAVIERAQERLNEAENNFRRVSATRASGFISDAFISNAIRERYAALQEKASREAERRSSIEQLENLRKVQAEAKAALDDIRAHYNDGIVRAPAGGVVGAQVSRPGDVLKSGEYLAEIHVGEKFVLAYLETGTLYTVVPGDRVAITYGFLSSGGTVREVLPITVPLPGEFQKTFRPASRGQVAKIALDDPATFPLFAKVRISGESLLPFGGKG